MNKKLFAVLMTMICAVTLCFALAGCGGDPKANFVGSWELESIEDAEMGHVDTAILKQMGMEVSMTLNEDGSADFVMFGQSIDATWEANSATSMTLTLAGESDAMFVLAEGKLVSDDGETTMTFVKANSTTAAGSASNISSSSTGASSSSSSDASSSSLTVSQQNAVKKAKSYLDYSAFSLEGLIDQLEFEGFSHEDAVYGAEHSGADWMIQAEKKAKEYLEYSAFSRSGLIDQLEYEGFTSEQAAHGADSVGL